jgi:branched-chain amino acid aminotransferase
MSATPNVIWLDGRVVPADRPNLSVRDRGFQLGDGLFETLRCRRGVPIEWAEHRDRLLEGAAALELNLPVDGEGILAGLRALLEAAGLSETGLAGGAPGDAAIRITVTRGALAGRGTLPADWRSAAATVAIQTWPYVPPTPDQLGFGLRAIVSSVRHDPESPLAGVKTTSRADHVFAKLEAERSGADDALFLTPDGHVAEATSANVFAIHGDVVLTPPLASGILRGATRTWVIGASAVTDMGLEVEERPLRPSDLVESEEAFLSSSVAGLLPLVELDGRRIGNGRPGPRTMALREARERWIDEQALAAVEDAAAVEEAAAVDARPEPTSAAPAPTRGTR